MSAPTASLSKKATELVQDLMTSIQKENEARSMLGRAQDTRKTAQDNLTELLTSMPDKAIGAFGTVFWLDKDGQLRWRILVSVHPIALEGHENDQPQSSSVDPEPAPNPLLASAGSTDLGPKA